MEVRVRAESGRVRGKFGCAGDMLSGPDNRNDEDITRANGPDEQIDSKLLSRSLSNAHTLHKPNTGEQRSGDP